MGVADLPVGISHGVTRRDDGDAFSNAVSFVRAEGSSLIVSEVKVGCETPFLVDPVLLDFHSV